MKNSSICFLCWWFVMWCFVALTFSQQTDWYGFPCPHPQCVCCWSDCPSGEACKYPQIFKSKKNDDFYFMIFCNLNCFPVSIVLNAHFFLIWSYYNVLSFRPSMTTSRRLSRQHLRDPWRESWDTQRTRYRKYKSFWIIHNSWYALTNQLCVRHI